MAELTKPWILSPEGKKAVNVESCLCLVVEDSRAHEFDLVAYHLSNPSGKTLLGTFTSLDDATERLQAYVSATTH